MKRFIQSKVAFTLAEVFSPHSKGQRKIAFTLAEVLITLGIIGVVAAITMPTLIQNYKKTVYVNQLKKSVSMFEQGFKKMIADEGVDSLFDIPQWDEDTFLLADYTEQGGCTAESCPAPIVEYLKKYFKCDFVKIKYKNRLMSEPESTFDDENYVILFSDGTLLAFQTTFSPRKYNDIPAYLEIDVNGTKGPNVRGRDVFVFTVSENGNLVPVGAGEWKDDPLYCGREGGDPSNSDGDCAARIIENGWVMDY